MSHPGFVRQMPKTYQDPNLQVGFQVPTNSQATDFSLWSEEEIKMYLDVKGEDYEDCSDKIELIKRACECEQNTGQIAVKPSIQKKENGNQREVDPLDAFMTEMNQFKPDQEINIKEQQTNIKKQDQEVYFNDEQEDHVADFIQARQKNPEYLQQQAALANKGYDSDEQVYEAAKIVDKNNVQVEYDSDDQVVGVKKKEIEPLPYVDHTLINYDEFKKDFYLEAPSVKALTEEQVFEVKKQLQIKVQGLNASRPISSFSQLEMNKYIIDTLKKYGYDEPTPIQAQALPCVLNGRDVLGIAKTGSGKTLAYLIPMIVHIMDQRQVQREEGPIGLVIAPTRELAEQIHKECKKFSKPYAMKISAAFGGLKKYDQIRQLRGGVEAAVCTPGRIIDLIKAKGCNLQRVTFVVLDEADRMFELGMEYQVRSIMNTIRPDRQSVLFTATMPNKIQSLAQDVMNYPIQITIGQEGVANQDILQMTEVMENDDQKNDWLVGRLSQFIDEGEVLIFANQKTKVDKIVDFLKLGSYKVEGMHGDMDQFTRMAVLQNFKDGKSHVLVATDVAARGLDIKSIKTVINYDSPSDITTYIHRVGRTGRAGDKEGCAFSLLLQSEVRFACQLAQMLSTTDQPISISLRMLAMKDKKFKQDFQKKPKQKVSQGGQVGRNVGGAGLGFNKGYTNAGLQTLNSLYGSGSKDITAQNNNQTYNNSTSLLGIFKSNEIQQQQDTEQVQINPSNEQRNFKTGQRDMLKDFYTGQFRGQFQSSTTTIGGQQNQQPTVTLPQKRGALVNVPQSKPKLQSVHERPLYAQAPPKHFSDNYRASINTYSQQKQQGPSGLGGDYNRAVEQAKLIAERLAAKKS